MMTKKNNYQKIKWILIIFLVMLFIGSGIRFTYNIVDPRGFFGIGLPSKMKLFVSDTSRFSIVYPETWTAIDTPHGNHGDLENIVIIKPFRTWPSLHIASKEFPEGTIDQVAQWGEARAKVLNEYKQIETDGFNTTKINGKLLIYEWQEQRLFSEEVDIKCADYYTLVEEAGYILKFCAEQSQWPDVESVFQQMIENVEIR